MSDLVSSRDYILDYSALLHENISGWSFNTLGGHAIREMGKDPYVVPRTSGLFTV